MILLGLILTVLLFLEKYIDKIFSSLFTVIL